MFDYADRQEDCRQPAVGAGLDRIDAELRSLGFLPPPRYGVDRNVICGSALRVSVREVLQSSDAGQAQLRRLCGLVNRGVPVNLSAEDFTGEDSIIKLWQRFCEVVRRALPSRVPPAQQLGLSLHSHQMPLEAFRLIADAILGRGPRYVFLDSLQMSAHCNTVVDERARANWSFLWRQRITDRPVLPVYGGIIRSACPLLADEVANCILPGAGLHTPGSTAWLPITLPMTAFVTMSGQVRWNLLTNAIGAGLSIAERLHSRVCWWDETQRTDAYENRRLAIIVTELGDIVRRRGDDPASLPCLRWLASMVSRIRNELLAQSRQIATENGAVPALEQANHVSQWRAGPERESWRRHWNEALRRAAMRHRNLLVISPYAVVPGGAPSTAAYGDLLPVIALADAWNFSSPPDFNGWNAVQYRNFHRRARAIIQGSHSASFVAAGV